MKRLIPALAALSLILAASPAFFLYILPDYLYISASGLAASYMVMRKTRKLIIREGRNRTRKVVETTMTSIVPLLSVGTASLLPAVTIEVASFSTVSVASAIILKSELSSSLGKKFSLKFGTGIWISILSLSIVLTYSKSYYAFYGVLIAGSIAVLDLFSLGRQIFE